jgi:hypothetical protein
MRPQAGADGSQFFHQERKTVAPNVMNPNTNVDRALLIPEFNSAKTP